MTILGVNANNLLNKIDSFKNWLKEKSPAIFIVQETKVPTLGQLKTISNQFQIYEQIRENNPGLGGGICIGVSKNLHSTLLREGGVDVECISVLVEVGQHEIVVVCGYGPQENAGLAKKESFWHYLEREVEEASREDKMLVIQMDSNSWLGKNTIPGDPNLIPNSNGKMFASFLQRNSNITLVNSLAECEGVITRQRVTDLLNEKSSIDVFLVCERTLPFVKKMFIDEKRESPLTNFHNLKKGKKITETDHNKLELFLNIEAPTIKPIREVLFNFKSEHNQKVFHEISSDSEKLRNSFKLNQDLQHQATIFEKTLNNLFFSVFSEDKG